MVKLLHSPTRWILLLLLAATGSAGLSAQDAPPTLTIQQNGAELTAGDEDFSDWQDIPVAGSLDVLKTQNDSGVELNGDSDLDAEVKMTYDATNLYILVDVTDDVISTENEEQPWHNDGIEISLLMTDDADLRASWSHNSEQEQPGQQKIFYNVDYDTDDVIEGSNSAEGDYSNASVTTMMKGPEDARTGYMVEFVLPWAAINNGDTDFDPMAAGSRFSMNVAVNDNDNEENPNNAEFNARREHTVLLVDANMNNQGELFAFVELSGTDSGTAAMFSNDPYFGDSENYSFLANGGDDEEDWTVETLEGGEMVLSLTNADIVPVHPTGTPYYNPGDGFTDGQESAPGGRAIAADTSFADFEMLVDMKRPEDQTDRRYDLAVIFGYTDEDNFSYVNFGIDTEESSSTIVPVVDGTGLRTPNDPRTTNILPVFPNDNEFHTVLLRREGSQVALFIDDEPVMFTSQDTFSTAGSVGFGSWNDSGIFDNVSVAALTGDYESKMSFITAATVGTLTFDTIRNVEEGLTVSEMIAGLTLSEGATAMIVNADDEDLGDDDEVAAGSSIEITAEAGNTKTYGITFGSAVADNGPKIERVFSPVTINTDSTELTITTGSDVALLLAQVRAPAGVTEQVIDADGEVITDSTTVLTEEMEYQLVGENDETRNYAIRLVDPTYPVINIAPIEEDVVIDQFFTEWETIEQQFEIDGIGTGGVTDTMPSDEDISGYFKATYDDSYLYLYFNITDDVLNTSAAQSFRNDGIEIAILTGSSAAARSQYNLFFNEAEQPGNQKFVYTYGADFATTYQNSADIFTNFKKPASIYEGAVIATFDKEDDTGYEVEMQLPWSGLSQNDSIMSDEAVTGMLGESFSINVAINDNDGGDERQSVRYYASPQLNRDGVDFAIFTLANTTPTRHAVGDFAIDVFPNPTGAQLQIKTDKQVELVSVYSLTGQLLLQQTNSRTVDVARLQAGPYLMQIRTRDNLVKMVRFIKR